MRVFVMGDLHGASKALEQCLKRSDFDLKRDTLIQLGDIVDGYPDVYKCVETLLKIPNLIPVKGNHEDWFLEFIRTGYHPAAWDAGGQATLISYLELTGRNQSIRRAGDGFESSLIPEDIPSTHRRFFESQKPFYVDKENNCFVHAGFNRFLSFDKQDIWNFYWDRGLWEDALTYQILNKNDPDSEPFYNLSKFHEIFIGHTPTLNWNTDKPMRALNIFNVDTGAGHGGKLTLLNIHSKEYFQSDPVAELYNWSAR
ncbi:MAG TPA: metallophosphoesterase [Puia sp.]